MHSISFYMNAHQVWIDFSFFASLSENTLNMAIMDGKITN